MADAFGHVTVTLRCLRKFRNEVKSRDEVTRELEASPREGRISGSFLFFSFSPLHVIYSFIRAVLRQRNFPRRLTMIDSDDINFAPL